MTIITLIRVDDGFTKCCLITFRLAQGPVNLPAPTDVSALAPTDASAPKAVLVARSRSGQSASASMVASAPTKGVSAPKAFMARDARRGKMKVDMCLEHDLHYVFKTLRIAAKSQTKSTS